MKNPCLYLLFLFVCVFTTLQMKTKSKPKKLLPPHQFQSIHSFLLQSKGFFKNIFWVTVLYPMSSTTIFSQSCGLFSYFLDIVFHRAYVSASFYEVQLPVSIFFNGLCLCCCIERSTPYQGLHIFSHVIF